MKKLERKLRNTRQTVEAFVCNCNCATNCATQCYNSCHGSYPDYSYPGNAANAGLYNSMTTGGTA